LRTEPIRNPVEGIRGGLRALNSAAEKNNAIATLEKRLRDAVDQLNLGLRLTGGLESLHWANHG
jgi:hypothetical protein